MVLLEWFINRLDGGIHKCWKIAIEVALFRACIFTAILHITISVKLAAVEMVIYQACLSDRQTVLQTDI